MEPRKHEIPHQRGVEGIPRVRVRGELRAVAVLWPGRQDTQPAAGRWVTLGGAEDC